MFCEFREPDLPGNSKGGVKPKGGCLKSAFDVMAEVTVAVSGSGICDSEVLGFAPGFSIGRPGAIIALKTKLFVLIATSIN